MPVYPGAQDFHLQAIERARHTNRKALELVEGLFVLKSLERNYFFAAAKSSAARSQFTTFHQALM